MKKTMKMIIAAMLAIASIPTAATYAEDSKDLWYWGTQNGEPFSGVKGMEQIEGTSLFGEDSLMYLQTITKDEETSYQLYSVHPFQDTIGFVLRENLDAKETMPSILDILDKFYPGLKDSYDAESGIAAVPVPTIPYDYSNAEYIFSYGEDRMFQLTDRRKDAFPQNTVEQIRKTLAAQGLITEYYCPGQTAVYERRYTVFENMLTYYGYDATQLASATAYLAEHYPDCEIAMIDTETQFQILSGKPLTFKEQLEVAMDLYKNVGIRPEFTVKASSSNQTMIGHNAMEQSGDANLDCEVDILDVIAANKHILGVETFDKTGVKNMDMNGNGKTESDDSLAILKLILDIRD